MTSPTLPQATSDAASLLAPAAESVPLMRKAARPLVGEHDFAAFYRSRTGTTTTRRLRSVTVRRLRGLGEVRLLADASCWPIFRSIVGHLLQMGNGRCDPASTPWSSGHRVQARRQWQRRFLTS
jgi:tRNA U38,U39,U40 pseudouridine synthase TruA